MQNAEHGQECSNSDISHGPVVGLMLESALGTDLTRFGEYQTRLVKLNPKLETQLGEGGAPAVPTATNTPVPAPLVTAPTGIPAPDQADATTPGNCSAVIYLSACGFWLDTLLCVDQTRSQYVTAGKFGSDEFRSVQLSSSTHASDELRQG